VNFSELGKVIEQLGKDRGIKKEIVYWCYRTSFLVTARKKFGIQGEYEARYNEDDGEVEIFQYKNVVDES
jgi:N utilization substance protein A